MSESSENVRLQDSTNMDIDLSKQVLSGDQTEKRKASVFAKAFWITIILLFVISLAMILLGVVNSSDASLKTAAKERAYDTLSEDVKKLVPNAMKETISRVAKDPFSQEFQQAMFKQIDQAFLPVYQSIPSFVDAHYSVLGEYMEMGAAATGGLAEHIKNQLFSGFDARLKTATDNIAHMIPEDLQKRMDAYVHNASQESRIPIEQRKIFESVLSEELKTHMTTFRNTSAISGGFIGAIGAVASIKLIATAIARKLLIKLGAKYAAKLALKSGSSAGSAAAGAAVGTLFIPGIGTAIGGVVGAIAGWVAVDAVFVTVDEWLNRDDFEKDLRNSITEQKNKLKYKIAVQVHLIKSQLEGLGNESVVGQTPASL